MLQNVDILATQLSVFLKRQILINKKLDFVVVSWRVQRI
jgi:hypothetical protein